MFKIRGSNKHKHKRICYYDFIVQEIQFDKLIEYKIIETI